MSVRIAALSGLAVMLAVTLSGADANATQVTYYNYSIATPDGATSAGDVRLFSTSYNATAQELSFSTTIRSSGGHLADGYWLVLSPGPNPKGHAEELAIFFADRFTGNLSAYVYNGVNGPSSWNSPGTHLGTFAGAVSVTDAPAGSNTDRTFSFTDIGIAAINGFGDGLGWTDWTGAAYGAKIGIWFHPVELSAAPTYDGNGRLLSYPVTNQSWYDTNDRPTELVVVDVLDDEVGVPGPAAAGLVLAGLTGLVGARGRR